MLWKLKYDALLCCMINQKQWPLKFGIQLLFKGNLQVATLKYCKDLMKLTLIFLARLETVLSHTAIGEEAKKPTREITCL